MGAEIEGASVHGSIVRLSLDELHMLDLFEGCNSSAPHTAQGNVYYRQTIDVETGDGEIIGAVAYVRSSVEWEGEPSVEYLRACQRNIVQFWPDHGATIMIRRVDGDGTPVIVREWVDEIRDGVSM